MKDEHEVAIDSGYYVYVIIVTGMPRRNTPREDPKAVALRAAGALHPHPEAVQDEIFSGGEFFDRRDRVQVKYEMLRRHRVDGRPVTDVAAAFSVSRQAFYTSERAFAAEGIVGLLPRPRGPKRAHKCTDEVLDFAERWHAKRSDDTGVVAAIEHRFGVTVHPRSLERALDRRKKKRRAMGRAQT